MDTLIKQPKVAQKKTNKHTQFLTFFLHKKNEEQKRNTIPSRTLHFPVAVPNLIFCARLETFPGPITSPNVYWLFHKGEKVLNVQSWVSFQMLY